MGSRDIRFRGGDNGFKKPKNRGQSQRFQDASLLALKIEKGDKSAGNLRQSLDTGKGEEMILPQGL